MPKAPPYTLEVWKETRIDTTELEECYNNILSDLKNLEFGVANLIDRFSGDIPKYDWKLTVSEGLEEENAITEYDRKNGVATTTLNKKLFKDATEFSIARTILHESIHAYLEAYLHTQPIEFQVTYPEIILAWEELKDLNKTHHQFMEEYVGMIAVSLAEYGRSKGYEYDFQFYLDLSWGGLFTTDAFKNLPSSERSRILDTVNIEQYGHDYKENPETPKGTKANC